MLCALFFYRINGDNNDLPWPFTVDRYPTLVYFPSHDKAESISYPSHLELSLPNLIQFVRSAAGPTADIGVCLRTCIQTNLRITAAALGKLHVERRWLVRRICRLRLQLAAMFVKPFSSGHDAVETNLDSDEVLGSASSFAAGEEIHVDDDKPVEIQDTWHNGPHVAGVVNPASDGALGSVPLFATDNKEIDDTKVVATADTQYIGPGTAVPDDRPVRMSEGPADNELPRCIGESCTYMRPDTIRPDQLGNGNVREGSYGRTCSVEHLLRMRDELAVLRRHLYVTDVRRSFLRHSYSNVLLPSAVRGSHQLARRRWQSIRRRKLISGLRLRNHRDYVSGWDMGS